MRWITKLLQRYPWAMPLVGFVSGAASFFLVEREQDRFAQSIAILMLVSWVWLALEKLLRQGVQRWLGAPLPPPLVSFATQMVHQESLFFVIPFFAITTAWNTGQMVFTSALAVFALVSILDPIYFHWLAARRWLYFIFHGVTSFAVLLTALPILFHLPTPKAYLLSLGAAIALSLPGVVSGSSTALVGARSRRSCADPARHRDWPLHAPLDSSCHTAPDQSSRDRPDQ
ncbi:MAG: DUF5924 family protein [Cellvibrionaceae bacterium]|nr:DUF5924 family protein [Cellvibrionaceae bacterium]